MRKFLTEDQLVKHIFAFEKWSKRMFRKFQDHEDCVGWVTEHFIKDHSRTYSYYTAYVDYMRAIYGRNGHKIRETIEFIDQMIPAEINEVEFDEDKEIVRRKMMIRCRNMSFITDHAKGHTMKEIGEKRGITESRVSKIVKSITDKSNRLYDRIKFLRSIDLREETRKCLIQVI